MTKWYAHFKSHAVADITVMLALMAGRNVKETLSLVHRGEV